MSQTDLDKLFTAYRALSDEQQTALNVLAIYYGYSSLTGLGKCLTSLNIKDANNKMLKSDAVKTLVKPMIKAGLIEENPKTAAIRCLRLLAEPIARRLTRDQQLDRYAHVVEEHNPLGKGYYRYNALEDFLRDARLCFYRREFKKIETAYGSASRFTQAPDFVDLYLSWLLPAFDGDWIAEHLPPDLLHQFLGLFGVHVQQYLYRHPTIEAFMLKHSVSESGRVVNPFAYRIVLELQWLRGEWQTVAQAVAGQDDAELQAIGAALTFLNGDFVTSCEQFEQVLATLRKQSGKRTLYFYGLAGLFYPLAILKNNDPKLRAKLPTLLSQAIKIASVWTSTYRLLDGFQGFMSGDLSLREQLLNTELAYRLSDGYKDSGMPETLPAWPLLFQPLLLLIKYWMKADQFNHVLPQSRKLYQHLHEHGYRWPAAELGKIFAAVEPPKSKQWDVEFLQDRPLTLAELFVTRPDWELALDALSNLQKADGKTDVVAQTDKPTRLVWLLTFGEHSQQLSLEPREQKQQAKGGWSKGRTVALKRLLTERDSFDYLSEHDLRVCQHIHEYRDNGWYGSAASYDFDYKVPLTLIGHPLLFWADSPEVRVEAVKGDVELRVSKQDNSDKIRITLEPMPLADQKIRIIKESPTRLKVVELNADHHKIATVLGPKGLDVPLSAQDRVLQTLTGISSMLTVHSDIGGTSGNAEQVESDTTPRVHLLPFGEGLKVALLIRPFATGGAYFQPGHGGASVLAEIDGRRVHARRDLAQEKARAEQILQACPQLHDAERDQSGDWLLEDPEQCLELLLQLQALSADSVILEWPEGVRFKVLGQSAGSGFSMQIKRDNDWFALQGELQVDENTVIEIQQLLGLLDNTQGRFLRLQDGQFVALTEAFRRRLEDLKIYADLSGKKVRINPLAALTLEDWHDEADFKADRHWQAHMQRLKAARDYQPQVPSTFQAELRDYQTDGYRWLARLAQWGVGACLADDMGLGKTVQALALLVERAPNGPSLIVAPTSVCMNWENEACRFAPTLNAQVLGSGDRQSLLDKLGPYDLLICSYGLLQQEQVADMLAKIPFQTAILDEAQWIKNVATRRSQGAMNLQADFKLILTGTPLENHLGELWNLFRFINPGLLGSLEQFNQRFAGPIERDRNVQARQQLKKLIQPFILRRTKTQVLQELPPRTEIPIYVELSSEEMAFYEALRRDSLAVLTSNDGPPGAKHLQILAAITKLRRSCCNTRLANADIALPSSKLAAFGEIVDELLDNKHKALVFSQFVDHLQLIKDYVEQRGIRYQYLDGSTPAKERQQRVDAFQRGEGELFLISLKAGGVGLNLTAADYVIHMDPWWNPAVEDQASDRAHRMGQQRPVTIYRMIAKQTIEEKIVALHGHKRDLADSLLDGADVSGKMSADDLLSLMKADS